VSIDHAQRCQWSGCLKLKRGNTSTKQSATINHSRLCQSCRDKQMDRVWKQREAVRSCTRVEMVHITYGSHGMTAAVCTSAGGILHASRLACLECSSRSCSGNRADCPIDDREGVATSQPMAQTQLAWAVTSYCPPITIHKGLHCRESD
jgi:hypothetical protein